MTGYRAISFVLALFAAVAATAYPKLSYADAASKPAWMNDDCSAFNQKAQEAETVRAQRLVQSNADYWRYLPPIDLATYNCLNKVENALDQLEELSSTNLSSIGDLKSLAKVAAKKIVANLINQACDAAVGTFEGATKFVYSQVNRFCVPLPNLNLNLGLNAATFPAGPPCNGTPLIQAVPLQSNTSTPPRLWSVWGKTPGESGVKP